MTIAQKLQRTRELNAELNSLWPGTTVSVGIHTIDHQEVHEGGIVPTTVFLSGVAWTMSIALGPDGHVARVFATVDPSCEDCRRLRPTLAKEYGATVGAAVAS